MTGCMPRFGECVTKRSDSYGFFPRLLDSSGWPAAQVGFALGNWTITGLRSGICSMQIEVTR